MSSRSRDFPWLAKSTPIPVNDIGLTPCPAACRPRPADRHPPPSLIPITIEKKNGEDHTQSLGPEGMLYGTWNVSLLIAIGYVSWQGRYSMETHDRRQWGERQWLAQTNLELERETRLQARHVDELEKENQVRMASFWSAACLYASWWWWCGRAV